MLTNWLHNASYHNSSRLIFLFLVIIGFGFCSCRKTHTIDLIPENCQGIVRIDIPGLVPRLLANRPMLDSLEAWAQMPLEEMGINFLEPAYIILENEDNRPRLIFGISNKEKWEEKLKSSTRANIENQGELNMLWSGNLVWVWNHEIVMVEPTNAMLGKPTWNPEWENRFAVQETKIKLPFSGNADIQFIWNVNETMLGGVVPPLEAKIEGMAEWKQPNFEIHAKIEEHQYLALLRPFSMVPEKRDGQCRFWVWPAMESIFLQIDAYGGNAYQREMNHQILDLLTKMDYPFECSFTENEGQDLLKGIQIKTRFENAIVGKALETEIQKMLPSSALSDYAIAEKNGTIIFHHNSLNPQFQSDFSSSGEKLKDLVGVFTYKGKNVEMDWDLSLKEPGNYYFSLHLKNGEHWRSQPIVRALFSLDPEAILNRFSPESNDPLP